MSKRVLAGLAIFLMTASAAQAQYGGGMGGGGGGMGGGGMGGGGGPPGRGGGPPPPNSPSSPMPDRPPPPATPLNKIEIVGVIKAIDPATERITIAYEPVDALNWPAGTMPFGVSHTALLKDVTVGERVRFKLQSQQISELKPYGPPPAQ